MDRSAHLTQLIPADGTEARRSFDRSVAVQRRLHTLVPGGAHTHARGSDQYPESMTPVLVRGYGARVLDVDGNWYVEYGMGLRSVTLGHGYRPVVEAVAAAAAAGTNFTRPTVLELEAAETFLEQVPGANMVKFAKNGSDVTTAAVKLARAATGRTLVGVCEDHPFFSTDDWFIATTPMTAGIPPEHRMLTVPFRYNDLDSVQALLETRPGEVACLILEAATATVEPSPGFLEGLRALCDKHDVVLIFDEIITGMRWSVRAGPADLRRHARPVNMGQSTRQWLRDLGSCRSPRIDGPRRAQHRCVPPVPAVHDVRSGDHGAGRVSGGTPGVPRARHRRHHGASGQAPCSRGQCCGSRRGSGGSFFGGGPTVVHGLRDPRRGRSDGRRNTARCSSKSCCAEESWLSRSSFPLRTPTMTSTRRSTPW